MGTHLIARRWRTLSIFVALAAGSVVVSGCSAGSDPSAVASATAVAVDSTEQAAEPTPIADAPTEAASLPTTSAALGDAVSFDTGVDVQIAEISAIEVQAETPGEVAGSAVAVRVRVTNASTSTVDLDSAVVMLSAADGEVGIGTTAGTNTPFAGSLAPGESAEASYVFMLASPAGRTVTVTVNYGAGQPVAEFTGEIA